jgi:biopolymer transport protein ExbD
MASMTDIVFLLLIFFMLTVSSVTPQALLIDLPMSNNADVLLPQVSVMITADLTYYVDQQPTTRGQLEELLQKKLNTDQRFVLLQIDKSVPIAHMIYVTDIAASLHAKVAVATQPDS